MKPVGLLLAGGQSRRLGQDKAQLRMAHGLSLLEQSAALLRQVAEPCWFAPGEREDLKTPKGYALLRDLPTVQGPASALLALVQHHTEELAQASGVLVLALDQPCLELIHLQFLLEQSASSLAVEDGGRPALPAWIRREDFPLLEASPEPQPRLMATLQSSCRKQVSLPQTACGLPATFNLNTPDDLQRYLEHCRAPGHDPAC